MEERLPVIHFKKGMIVVMLPNNTDMAYIQKDVQRCIIEVTHKTIDGGSNRLLKKVLAKIHGDSKVLVDLAYPPSNFEHQKKGTKTNYNTQNK